MLSSAEAETSEIINININQNSINQAQQQQPRIYSVTDGLRSKHTKTNYRLAFKQFLKDGAKTQDLQVLLDYKPRIIEQMVIGYIENLVDKNRSHRTINLHCAAIFHFFEMNDIVLNKRKITRFIPPDESAGDFMDGVYTVEEISRIVNEGCNDLRTKLMVMLMASTGMRIGALPGLLVGHLHEMFLAQSNVRIYMAQVYAGTKSRYYVFTTPECTALIDSYLEYRRRLGETITEKSPLIREMFDSYNRYIIDAPKRLSEKMIQTALEQALRRANVNQRVPSIDIDNKGKRRGIMRSHGFRKFAITQMIKARIDYSVREFLVGHKHSRGLDVNYDRTSIEDRLQEWSSAIDFLTIDPNQRLKKKVQELESEKSQEIERLKTQLQKYQEEQEARAKELSQVSNQSLEELRARIEATENRFDKAIMATEYAQKVMILDKERERERLEEMTPEFRKMYLDWQKTSDYGRKESFTDYYGRSRKRVIK